MIPYSTHAKKGVRILNFEEIMGNSTMTRHFKSSTSLPKQSKSIDKINKKNYSHTSMILTGH